MFIIFYKILTFALQRTMFVNLILLVSYLVSHTAAMNTNYGSLSFVSTNVFTKSKNLNSLYAVGSSDRKIYRLNYTRNLTTGNFNYNFSTTHTNLVKTIAVSQG